MNFFEHEAIIETAFCSKKLQLEAAAVTALKYFLVTEGMFDNEAGLGKLLILEVCS